MTEYTSPQERAQGTAQNMDMPNPSILTSIGMAFGFTAALCVNYSRNGNNDWLLSIKSFVLLVIISHVSSWISSRMASWLAPESSYSHISNPEYPDGSGTIAQPGFKNNAPLGSNKRAAQSRIWSILCALATGIGLGLTVAYGYSVRNMTVPLLTLSKIAVIQQLSIHMTVPTMEIISTWFDSGKIRLNTPFTAADHISDGKQHLLLCATGSVATIKIPNIVQALSHHRNLSIRILLTASAKEFLQGQAEEQPSLLRIRSMPNVDGIYLDEDEWRQPWTRGASILHIELRRWADIMVIAPLSANGLANLSLGMSHNLIYSVARAWDTTGLIDAPRPGIHLPYTSSAEVEDPDTGATQKIQVQKKGIIVAPAMNTAMWNHPVTKRHLEVLEKDWDVEREDGSGWMEVLRPIDKGLACGDKGGGGMREWKEIVKVIEKRLKLG